MSKQDKLEQIGNQRDIQEEAFLKHLKENEMIKSWKEISKRLNSFVSNKGRTGKQCRERYMNFLRFGEQAYKIVGWTTTQDQCLFQRFLKIGPKWSQISKQMRGRSENSIKNRFHGIIRKAIRRITKCQKQLKMKQKKPIKNGNLIQILRGVNRDNFSQSRISCLSEDQVISMESLRRDLIKYLLESQVQGSTTESINIVHKIHKYNMIIRDSAAKGKNQTSVTNPYLKKNADQHRYSKQNENYSFHPTRNSLTSEHLTLSGQMQSLIDINQTLGRQLLSEKSKMQKPNGKTQINLFDLLDQQCRDSPAMQHTKLLY